MEADRPILVCHVIHSLGAGGAEQVLTELARRADEARLDLLVVALSPVDDPVHARALRDQGVEVVALDRGRWDPRAIVHLARLLRQRRVDVVHTHLKHADVVGGLAARLVGVPQVSTLHMIEAPRTPMERVKLRTGSVVRNRTAARIIAVSRAQRDWYLASTRVDVSRVLVVPNGVGREPPLDDGARAALRAELGFPDGAVVALMATVIRPGKGHDVLLAACRGLENGSPLGVAVAGDGELMPTVREILAREPGLARRVRLLGYRHDVPRLMQACDLVVHPTQADALPTVLIQAIAAGRAVVASDVGGVPDIVGDDAGVLVPPGDPEALREALSQLAAAPDLRRRLGAAGQQRFQKEFDAGQWARRLRRLYDAALAG